MVRTANLSTEAHRIPTFLTLVCQGETSATRRAAFPLDEPLEATQGPPAQMESFVRVDAAWCSPARAAVQTAAQLALAVTLDAGLRDWEYGSWQGQRLSDIFANEPEAASRWMSDPTMAAPNGGESLVSLAERTRSWLSEKMCAGGHMVAVTHNAIIRLALLMAVDAPLKEFWSIDVLPWGRLRLTSNGRRWALRIG